LRNKRPAAGQFAAKRIRRHVERKELPADGRVLAVIQFERHREPGAPRRLGLDPGIVAAHAYRAPHHDLPHGAALFDNTRGIDRLDECSRRPVATRHLGRIDPNLAVIDTHPGQRGQYVFDHLDANAVQFKRRPPRLFNPQRGAGRNAGGPADVMPNERDAGMLRCGPEFNANIATAEVTKAGYRNWSGERALATRN
jgi:hypothetical protein